MDVAVPGIPLVHGGCVKSVIVKRQPRQCKEICVHFCVNEWITILLLQQGVPSRSSRRSSHFVIIILHICKMSSNESKIIFWGESEQ